MAQWGNNQYAWFTIEGINGGCDAYFHTLRESVTDFWGLTDISPFEIKSIDDNKIYWTFRRSVGQPSIINLSYGLVATAFAQLTDGYIISDDGAWDFTLFPTKLETFLTKLETFLTEYFNPNCPNLSYGDWAQRCLNSIKEND